MRTLFIPFLITLLISCAGQQNERKQSDQETPATEATQPTEEAPNTAPVTAEISSGHPVEFDPRYDWEENIMFIWENLNGSRPEKVDVLLLPSKFVKNDGAFCVISDIGETKYYTLIADENWDYTFEEVTTSDNSIVKTFGNSANSTAALYDLSFLEGDDKKIVLSFEIFGMVAAEGGDGMRPMHKVQHDVLAFNAAGKLTQDGAATQQFNENNGVDMKALADVPAIELLAQKYYKAVEEGFDQEKISEVLDDMKVLTKNKESIENTFGNVWKMEDGSYVNNTADAAVDAYFITGDNDFGIEQVESSDYPMFYLYDHGTYLYSITNIKLDSDVILLDAEPLYSMDEAGQITNETGEAISLMLQHINRKWVLKYLSSPMMMQKDRERLQTINSNAGE